MVLVWFQFKMNSFPFMDTPSQQLHTGEFPLKGSRNQLSNSYTVGKQGKIPTLTWVGKAETQTSFHKTSSLAQEGTHSSQLLPEEWRVWKQYLAPQHLRLPPKGWPPIHQTLKDSKTCVGRKLKTIRNSFNSPSSTCHGTPAPGPCRAPPPGLSVEAEDRNACLPIFL